MEEFTITEEHLDTGMRGYPVGWCTTSSVDAQKGLFYHKYPVSELAYLEPEEVIYLLMHGEKGSEAELREFKKELNSRSHVDPEVLQEIRRLSRKKHPMALFSQALLGASMQSTGDYEEDCLNLIAQIPQIVATVINHHANWEKSPDSDPSLSYMENFTHMLNVPDANKDELTQVFKMFNVLHYDHGGGNLSTFVGKATASSLEDLYGSLSSAMNALAGPRHGKANQDCLAFVKEVYSELGDDATPEQMETLIRNRLENKQLVYGFGHAVLRVEDPRATVFYSHADQLYANHPLVKIASLLRRAGEKVLGENPKVQDPHPNVDAISGTVLSAAGFPYPEYFTVLFGLSRCVGIAIQIVYERCEARDGKGTPIVRPRFLYKPKMAPKPV